jgi:hypothetical protein
VCRRVVDSVSGSITSPDSGFESANDTGFGDYAGYDIYSDL